MVIKGKARGNGGQLGAYLVTTGENERIEVVEIKGVCAQTVPEAVREMDAVSLCTRCDKPLYHASINTPAHEQLSAEQRAIAVDRLEKALGFEGQPRVVVVHEKQGRGEHTHIVWSRTDIEHQRAIRIDHNYRTHELVARELESEFGLSRTQGVHVERDGRPRPERTATHHEMLQKERTGIDPREVKKQVTEIWQRTGDGQSFRAELEQAGFVLARGDRRDFVVVDRAGGTHSLARRIEGANAAQVRERLADLDPGQLPSVKEAKEIQRSHRIGQDRSQEGKERGFRESPSMGAEKPPVLHGPGKVADGIANTVGKVFDGAAGLFENLLGGQSEPHIPTEAERTAAAEWATAAAKEAVQVERLGQESDDISRRRQDVFRQWGQQIEEGLERERTRRE